MATVEIPERARPLLEGRPIAFMTTMRPDGRMSTNPVAIVFDGTTLRISTITSRRKYRNLAADDRITVCVVQPDNLNRYVEIHAVAPCSSPTRTASSLTRWQSSTWTPTATPSTDRATNG